MFVSCFHDVLICLFVYFLICVWLREVREFLKDIWKKSFWNVLISDEVLSEEQMLNNLMKMVDIHYRSSCWKVYLECIQ